MTKTNEDEKNYETDLTIRTYRAKVQTFLDYVESSFRLTQVYEYCGANTTGEKNAIRQALHREKGLTVEPTGTYGVWRKINRDILWHDLSKYDESEVEKMDIILPVNLDSLVSIFQGDLVVLAGVTNTGKSSFGLELALQNRDMGVRYFSSELTVGQIQDRAKKDSISLERLSGINFAIRYDDYQDVVEPGEINIIDYLQAPGSTDEPRYYAIPHLISKIHEKMNGTGLTLICIQKDPGKRTGDGGFKTSYRSNLYLTLDKDQTGQYWMNIQK